MPLFAFDHIHVYSDDVERTVDAYKAMFQATELRRLTGPGTVLVHLSMSQARIVVSTATADRPPGLHHYAVAAAEDQFEQALAHLLQSGCTQESAVGRNGPYRNVFLRDRNRVVLELLSPSTE